MLAEEIRYRKNSATNSVIPPKSLLWKTATYQDCFLSRHTLATLNDKTLQSQQYSRLKAPPLY